MQAIETEFRGATNTRGARIIARAQAGRVVVPWDHALSIEENHDAACKAFVRKWGWFGTWVRGARAHKGGVYVCARSSFRCPSELDEIDPDVVVVIRKPEEGVTP